MYVDYRRTNSLFFLDVECLLFGREMRKFLPPELIRDKAMLEALI